MSLGIYEVSIHIKNEEYLDPLLLGLLHQGYDVVYDKETRRVVFTVNEDDSLLKIK